MQKNSMYYDTHRAKICKDIYRPSSNIARFLKSVISIAVLGRSPISHSAYKAETRRHK